MRKETRIIVLSLFLLAVLGAMYIRSPLSDPGERRDPNGGYRFLVEIDGIAQASFRSVEGINVSVSVAEYREGNDVINPILLPGIAHYGPLKLRYGIVDTETEIWDWMEDTLNGEVDRRDMSVILLNPKGEQLIRINLHEAWPSGWSLSPLDALEKGPALAELVIQYERMYIEP